MTSYYITGAVFLKKPVSLSHHLLMDLNLVTNLTGASMERVRFDAPQTKKWPNASATLLRVSRKKR